MPAGFGTLLAKHDIGDHSVVNGVVGRCFALEIRFSCFFGPPSGLGRRREKQMAWDLRSLSPERLAQIRQRQCPPKFGASYEPSIKATREEAPRTVRPTQIFFDLVGRYAHLLGGVEVKAFLYGAYFPFVWELQEQRMLPCIPAPHPLSLHSRGAGKSLPPLTGTNAIAAALGYGELLPRVRVKEGGTTFHIVAPFIGDLLWFVEDEARDPYLVNWNIKGTTQGFQEPAFVDRPARSAKLAREKVAARHQIEHDLYSEVGIPTRMLTDKDFDEGVAANLRVLHTHRARPTRLPERDIRLVENALLRDMHDGLPPLETSERVKRERSIATDEVRTVLHKAILRRRIRVELSEPILFDQPMIPERTDLLVKLSKWFSRETE